MLKDDLKERDLIHSETDIENIDFASRGDGQLPRRRKRQRSRRQQDAAGTSVQKRKRTRRSRANVSSFN
jgi:hypothetical protein